MILPIELDPDLSDGLVYLRRPDGHLPEVVMRASDGAIFRPEVRPHPEKELFDIDTEIEGATITIRCRFNADLIMRRIW